MITPRPNIVDKNGMLTPPWLVFFSNLGANQTVFTPTLSAGSGTLGAGNVATGYYIQIGQLVFIWIKIIFGASGNGTGATSVIATLPTIGNVLNDFFAAGQNETSGYMLQALFAGGTQEVVITKYDGSYPGGNSVTLIVSGFYISQNPRTYT